MIRNFAKASALFAGLTLAACGAAQTSSPTGTLNVDLTLPNGQTTNQITLVIACPAAGVNQTHQLNVTNGAVTAAFGGLTPGACTATLSAVTPEGTDCAGSAPFTVAANAVTPVAVVLSCQGRNAGGDGAAKISTTFSVKACTADRIKKLYAIPSNLLLGESTDVQAEVNPASIVGAPKYSWSFRNTATATAAGGLASIPLASCTAGSASCEKFTCSGLGASTTTDPATGFKASGIFVQLTVEDDECFDTEEVLVDCLQSSVCGDGVKGGVEQCDDGNTASNDGCSAGCVTEVCGDGIVQAPAEECDGMAGVVAGKTCDATCKLVTVVVAPRCGDNLVNQPSETCDGTATPAGETCSATCTLVARCGNNIKQGTEECDGTDVPAGRTCTTTCTLVPQANACDTCINSIPDIGAFNTSTCQTDPLCKSALSCVLSNPTCWSGVANVACYCGVTQANVDGCEADAFVPVGPCAAQLKAGAGTNPKNSEVLSRFFDFGYPSGTATVIVDAAFTSCRAQCF